MTTPAGFRFPVKGEVAVFRGELYRARAAARLWPCAELLPEPGHPAPDGLTPREAADGSVGYPVAPERLDAWDAVHWSFRWRGELFKCTRATTSAYSGDYLGSDERFAKEHLKRLAVTYYGVFPRDEVTELKMHRKDLIQPLHALVRRLDEVDHFRPKAYAVHHGRTYPAAAEADASGLIALTAGDDRPDDLIADPEDPSGERFLAAPEQLDAWYRTHWTFCWQRGPFDAVGTVDGRIKGVYTGGSWGFADSWQLTHEPEPNGAYTRYTVTAGLKGVTDLEHQRTDLIALAGAPLDLQMGERVYRFIRDRQTEDEKQRPEGYDWEVGRELWSLSRNYANAVQAGDTGEAGRLLGALMAKADQWKSHPHHAVVSAGVPIP
ncbi:hypothetical protein B7P34_12040 [Streptosporangium nondiastaticum]|uniref:Uncharacterized protein n=1 Tax=Streptosporangium nondiastaticum TaxID=35764 RepID=A0A9X7JRG7_9ACTN|nr:hypothetical protein [Streptosporangium nondiastaticum]PSJ28467.1 hypothetical protein B7P34_12040 [Streptosporangium nondiastaticum]